MEFRARYNDPETERVRDLTRTRNTMPSKTQAHHAEACDLNRIMRDYGVTRQLPIAAYPAGLYGDDDMEMSLSDAYQNVRIADEYFSALPSQLRSKFNHSPMALWQWVNDPANADEAVALGLLKRDAPPTSGGASFSVDTTST